MRKRRNLASGATAEWTDENPPNAGIVANFRRDFDNAVSNLDAKVVELNQAESKLYSVQSIAAQDSGDLQEWQNQFNRVNTAKSTVQSAQNAVATAADWLASIRNAFGLGVVFPAVVPWGTIAIIAAAGSALTAVILSASEFYDSMMMKEWNAENVRRSQEGLEPLPDSTRPVSTTPGGIFAGASELGKTVIFGLLALIVYNMVK